jgi:hypothetical protein
MLIFKSNCAVCRTEHALNPRSVYFRSADATRLISFISFQKLVHYHLPNLCWTIGNTGSSDTGLLEFYCIRLVMKYWVVEHGSDGSKCADFIASQEGKRRFTYYCFIRRI